LPPAWVAAQAAKRAEALQAGNGNGSSGKVAAAGELVVSSDVLDSVQVQRPKEAKGKDVDVLMGNAHD